MTRSFRLLFLFLACGFASAQTSSCSVLTHQALELSGFNQSLDQMAAIMGSDQFMQQVRGQESLEQFAAIYVPIVQKEFNAGLLRHEIESRMAAHCDVEQMTQRCSGCRLLLWPECLPWRRLPVRLKVTKKSRGISR